MTNRNKSRYSTWMRDFAANYGASSQVRVASNQRFAEGVKMESGNQGETKPSHEPAPTGFDGGSDARQKAFQDTLPSVEMSPDAKTEESQRIQRDTATTQSDADKNISSREKIMTGNPEDAVKHHFYPKSADKNIPQKFARNELAKIARAASTDVLDSLDDILQSAEEFVHKEIPVGQRHNVFASIEKGLKSKGISARFTREAKSDAPASGFDNYTWDEVSNFIQDDYRTVPGMPHDFVGGSPDSYKGGERTPTSIEQKVTKNPAAYTNKYNDKKGPVTASKLLNKIIKLANEEGVTCPPLGVTAPPFGMEDNAEACGEGMDLEMDMMAEESDMPMDEMGDKDLSSADTGRLADLLKEMLSILEGDEDTEAPVDMDMDMGEEPMDMDMEEEPASEDMEKEAGTRRSRFLS